MCQTTLPPLILLLIIIILDDKQYNNLKLLTHSHNIILYDRSYQHITHYKVTSYNMSYIILYDRSDRSDRSDRQITHYKVTSYNMS